MDDFDPGIKKQGRHTIDIKPRKFISVNIDHSQTGVGGDNSWGEKPYAKYTLYPGDYYHKFYVEVSKEHTSH
jgi:beta-galactosidase